LFSLIFITKRGLATHQGLRCTVPAKISSQHQDKRRLQPYSGFVDPDVFLAIMFSMHSF